MDDVSYLDITTFMGAQNRAKSKSQVTEDQLLRDRVSRSHYSDIERGGISPTLAFMSKSKIPATGEGYLGEIMVHRLSHAVGVVENVTEAKAGWPPQITLKLGDGSLKKGRLSDFREPTSAERKTISSE